MILLSGTTMAQLIPLLVSPVLTRIYTPEEFGALGLFVALVGILSNITSGRYERAIMLPRKNPSAVKIFYLSIILSLAVNMVFFLIILFLNNLLVKWNVSPLYVRWLVWVPIATFLYNVLQSFTFLNNRQKKYGKLAASKMTKSLGATSLQVGMGFMNTGAAGLIGGNIGGHVLGIGYLWNKSQTYLKKFHQPITYSNLRTEAIRYRNFPIYNTWTNSINKLSNQLPVLFFTRLFSASIVGWYSFAHRILATPVNLVGIAIGQVFYQKAAVENDNEEKFRIFTTKLINKLLNISFIPVALLLVFGDYIFGFVFGEEWRIAGEYSQALIVWLFFVFINAPLTHLFNVFEKQSQWFKINLIVFLARIAGILTIYWIFNGSLYVVIAFGVISALGQLVQLSYILNVMKINSARFVLKTLLLLAVATLPIYVIRYFFIA